MKKSRTFLFVFVMLVCILVLLTAFADEVAAPDSFIDVENNETINIDQNDRYYQIAWEVSPDADSYLVSAKLLSNSPDVEPNENSDGISLLDHEPTKKTKIKIPLDELEQEGWVKIAICAVDDAGNQSKWPYIYLYLMREKEPPEINIRRPKDGSVFQAGEEIKLRITGNNYDHYYYEIYCDDDFIENDTLDYDLDQAFYFDQPGNYHVYVVATNSDELNTESGQHYTGERDEDSVDFLVTAFEPVTENEEDWIEITEEDQFDNAEVEVAEQPAADNDEFEENGPELRPRHSDDEIVITEELEALFDDEWTDTAEESQFENNDVMEQPVADYGELEEYDPELHPRHSDDEMTITEEIEALFDDEWTDTAEDSQFGGVDVAEQPVADNSEIEEHDPELRPRHSDDEYTVTEELEDLFADEYDSMAQEGNGESETENWGIEQYESTPKHSEDYTENDNVQVSHFANDYQENENGDHVTDKTGLRPRESDEAQVVLEEIEELLNEDYYETNEDVDHFTNEYDLPPRHQNDYGETEDSDELQNDEYDELNEEWNSSFDDGALLTDEQNKHDEVETLFAEEDTQETQIGYSAQSDENEEELNEALYSEEEKESEVQKTSVKAMQPTITIDSPHADDVLQRGKTMTLAISGEDYQFISFQINCNGKVLLVGKRDEDCNISIPLINVGKYTVIATAINEGEKATATVTVTVQDMETVANAQSVATKQDNKLAKPKIYIDSPTNNAVYYVGDPLTLKITGTDYHHFYYSLQCDNKEISSAILKEDLINTSIALTKAGTYTLSVEATNSSEYNQTKGQPYKGDRDEKTITFKVISKNNHVVINGVDIGYGPGDYYTKNGKACKDIYGPNKSCHGHGICEENVDARCNCLRKFTINGKEIDTYAVQCLGFARYVQYMLYGTHEWEDGVYNTSSFKKIAVNARKITGQDLKEYISEAGVGSHLRFNYDSHSVIITGYDDRGFSFVQCNWCNSDDLDGKCKVTTAKYTWADGLELITNRGGIDFISMYIGQ